MMKRHEEFDITLNDAYQSIVIAGLTFTPADVLAECDPVAYMVMLNDWQDAQCTDGLHSHLESSWVCDFCGLDVKDKEYLRGGE